MITQFICKRIQTPREKYTHTVVYNTNGEPKKDNISVEINRRNKIISDLVVEFLKNFSIGDKVIIKGEPKYGKNLVVTDIVKHYHDFGKTEKWPKSDHPLIVSLLNQDDNSFIHCTTNAIEKVK
jgi:hypothetical protein